MLIREEVCYKFVGSYIHKIWEREVVRLSLTYKFINGKDSCPAEMFAVLTKFAKYITYGGCLFLILSEQLQMSAAPSIALSLFFFADFILMVVLSQLSATFLFIFVSIVRSLVAALHSCWNLWASLAA